MCGIAGIYIKDPNRRKGFTQQHTLEMFVDFLLLGIEHRGRDASGFVYSKPADPGAYLDKRPLTATEFCVVRHSIGEDARMVLCHTRWATKGEPSDNNNNHPVQSGYTFVTHNGHISNDDELFREHELDRIGQVDTEIIPAMISKHGIDKVHLALQELKGGFAIAAMNPRDFPETLVLAKGPSNPLVVYETDNVLVWASEMSVIKDAWRLTFGTEPGLRNIDFLKEGNILYVEDGKVEKLAFKVKEEPRPTYSYPRPATTSTHSRTGDYDWRDEYCMCGEKRWMHAGTDYSGKVLNTWGDCEAFRPIVAKNAESHSKRARAQMRKLITLWRGGEKIESIPCISCNKVTKVDECENVSGYLICHPCVLKGEYMIGKGFGNIISSDPALNAAAEELDISVPFAKWLMYDANFNDDLVEDWLIDIYCELYDAWELHDEQLNEKWLKGMLTLAEATAMDHDPTQLRLIKKEEPKEKKEEPFPDSTVVCEKCTCTIPKRHAFLREGKWLCKAKCEAPVETEPENDDVEMVLCDRCLTYVPEDEVMVHAGWVLCASGDCEDNSVPHTAYAGWHEREQFMGSEDER